METYMKYSINKTTESCPFLELIDTFKTFIYYYLSGINNP